MKQTKVIMGMPITLVVLDAKASGKDIADVFEYFVHVDETFSTYKPESEISRINSGLAREEWSDEVTMVLELCEQTKKATNGYFDIAYHDKIDPSGLVKGWAIQNAAQMLHDRNLKNFYIEAGGDVQVSGLNEKGLPWRVGIRSPFNRHEHIKTIAVTTEGVATSGTYIRGQHVYDPHSSADITDIISLTVSGPNIYDADRFATAAFAMGAPGIRFIESLAGFEGYMVDNAGIATMTSGFEHYTAAA